MAGEVAGVLGKGGEEVPLHAPAAHRDDIEDGNGPVRLSRLVVREEVAPDDPCVGIAPVLAVHLHGCIEIRHPVVLNHRAGSVPNDVERVLATVIGLAGTLDDEVLENPERREHRSEEHTSELQSLMRISYAVFCLKKKKTIKHKKKKTITTPTK